MNIVNNALDAFEENNQEHKHILLIFIKMIKQLFFIKDNAGGIKEEIIDRIFEPYFTTKHKSQRNRYWTLYVNGNYKKHMQGNLTVSNKEYSYETRDL